ncbi:hypothetical protein [Mucilaginibacter segetis]|nr:hypothetical protein [Mucilaginibacter segetis]
MKATLFWLPIKRYECNSCYKKTYIYGSVWEDVVVTDANNKGNAGKQVRQQNA